MIAVIASMDEELKLVLEKMENIKKEEHSFLKCYTGSFNNKPVVAVKCLTGKCAMAMTAQLIISSYHPSIIINIGVAGGINPSLNIGDVVIAKTALQHDMNAVGLGYKLGEIPDINKIEFESDEAFVQILASYKSENFKVITGKALTGDEMVTDEKVVAYLKDTFKGDCVDMETASLAHVAYMNNIPFGALRGISDGANKDAKSDFRKNLKKAADNAGLVMLYVLKNI